MVETNQAIRAAREYNESRDEKAIVKMTDDAWGTEVHIGGVAFGTDTVDMADELDACLYIDQNRNLVIY